MLFGLPVLARRWPFRSAEKPANPAYGRGLGFSICLKRHRRGILSPEAMKEDVRTLKKQDIPTPASASDATPIASLTQDGTGSAWSNALLYGLLPSSHNSPSPPVLRGNRRAAHRKPGLNPLNGVPTGVSISTLCGSARWACSPAHQPPRIYKDMDAGSF